MFERFGEMGNYEELNELAGNFLKRGRYREPAADGRRKWHSGSVCRNVYSRGNSFFFATRSQPQTGSLT